jgi:hypothetical protein
LFLPEHVQNHNWSELLPNHTIPASGWLFRHRNVWTPGFLHARNMDVKLKLKKLWCN